MVTHLLMNNAANDMVKLTFYSNRRVEASHSDLITAKTSNLDTQLYIAT